MGTRRGHGEGTIYQRPDGRWCGQVSLPDGNKRKTVYGKTRKEVQQRVNEIKRIVEQGLPVVSERLTVGDYLKQWLENVAKTGTRPRAYERYEDVVRLHVIPVLGKKRLARLSPQEVQALYNKKLETLAPGTIKRIHEVLHNALNNAIKWRMITWNVCDAVTVPHVPKPEIKPLTPEEAIALLDALREDRMEGICSLALTAALRLGEILGLRWVDVDLENRVLRVHRQIQRIRKRGLVESEPKSQTSNRPVVLTDIGVAALRRQWHRIDDLRMAAGERWDERGLVFPNTLGRPWEPRAVDTRFDMFLKKHNLPDIRFHDLRHSTATLLLSTGTHPKVVSEILGHSGISITINLYTHYVPPLHVEAMEQLNRLLNGRENGV